MESDDSDMRDNCLDIRFTFGMIVLNGEPFIKYNLRSLYPFAHQIIVVEGANQNSAHCATVDGHSIDNTMRDLIEFKKFEDLENKLLIVTAEDEGHPNGFWPGEKDEQSQAYSKRATGNWLWQIDVDEFYMEADMQRIRKMLEEDPSISTISFPEIPFWGSFDYRCDGIFLRFRYSEVHRLFKWLPRYKYLTHRPVTVVNDEGVDLRRINWVRAGDLRKQKIYMYHYYKIFLNQVSSKMIYYANWVEANKATHIIKAEEYFDKTFIKLTNPFRIHTVNTWPSWLEKFDGNHPAQIQALKNDIATGTINNSTRNMEDVEVLVKSIHYRTGILFWKIWGNYVSQLNWLLRDFLRHRIGSLEFSQSFFRIIIGKKRLFYDWLL
jgi:hypothetical protein